MKKLIILCSAVLGSLLFCGCLPSSAPYEDFYSRSFVLRYCQVSDISIERRYYSEDDPDYNLGYFIRVVSDKLYRANRNGEEKQVYDALCEKYNDVTYNRKVRYSYDEYYPPRCSCFFTDMEIWSTADWDAGHPAGTPLDDIVRFKSDTPLALYPERLYAAVFRQEKGRILSGLLPGFGTYGGRHDPVAGLLFYPVYLASRPRPATYHPCPVDRRCRECVRGWHRRGFQPVTRTIRAETGISVPVVGCVFGCPDSIAAGRQSALDCCAPESACGAFLVNFIPKSAGLCRRACEKVLTLQPWNPKNLRYCKA